MSTTTAALCISACLFLAVFVGLRLRRLLPEHHLSSESRDAVKLAVGLVATMTALLLGLLVSSAKGTYDSERSEIIQMAAKVSFLNRVLSLYGPGAVQVRRLLRQAVAEAIHELWNTKSEVTPQATFKEETGDQVFEAILQLEPSDDRQKTLKTQALGAAVELGQLRTLLAAQAVPSISAPLLVAVVCWLVLIFLIFSLLAPPNITTRVALLATGFSVAGAVFLILELDQPFSGMIRIPDQPMMKVLNQLSL